MIPLKDDARNVCALLTFGSKKEIDEVKKIRPKIYIVMHMETAEKLTCRRGFNSCKDGPHSRFHYRHHHLLFSVGRLSVYCNPMIRNWGSVIRTTCPQGTLTKSLHVLMESFTHGHIIMLQNLHESILHMITTHHEFWRYVLKDLNSWLCIFRIALK